jgi:hypothetical protein
VKPVRAPLEAKIAPFGPPQPKLTSPLPAAPILTGCAAVPFTTTTCGEAGASSVTVIVEDRMPAATGAKIIGFKQFAFAANVPTHVAVPSEKSFMLTPPGTMFVTCIGAFPVLVSSRFCGEEVIPTVTVPEAPGPKTAVSELAATIESPLGLPARLLAYIPGKAVPTVGHVGSACGRIQRHQKERGHLCAGRYASVAYRHIDRDAVTVGFGIDSSHLPQVRQRLGADRVQRRSRAPNVDETSVPEWNRSPSFAVQFLC